MPQKVFKAESASAKGNWFMVSTSLAVSHNQRDCHRFGITRAGMSTWPRRLDLLPRPLKRIRRLPRAPPHRAHFTHLQVLLLLPRLHPPTAL